MGLDFPQIEGEHPSGVIGILVEIPGKRYTMKEFVKVVKEVGNKKVQEIERKKIRRRVEDAGLSARRANLDLVVAETRKMLGL